MNYNKYAEETPFSASSEEEERTIENVLIMQGGGSLGAFACGVYKGLVKRKVRIDIAAGTSIGAVNAAIIAGSKSDHPEQDLEDFWMELAESNYHVIPDIYILDYDVNTKEYVTRKISSSSANASVFGVPKMFIPRWLRPTTAADGWPEELVAEGEDKISSTLPPSFLPYSYFDPRSWTYCYDHSPLAKTLDKYIDYRKLNLAKTEEKAPEVLRLIITAVDVLTAKPLIFDNTEIEIQPKHILASAGYPIYGFPWIKVESKSADVSGNTSDIYAWDGSLLSNTPIREVLNRSPRNDKHIFVVENYPKNIRRLPSNLAEVESRAKEILFSDKNMDTIKMSKLITRQIQLIKKLYNIFETNEAHLKLNRSDVKDIKSEYMKLIANYGAQILSITKIIRSEIESPTIFQNADFSPATVKELITQGERKTIEQTVSLANISKELKV
ncbi:MAG: patatin-like phospholipase family protein [Nitrososphaeraceae archaeon]